MRLLAVLSTGHRFAIHFQIYIVVVKNFSIFFQGVRQSFSDASEMRQLRLSYFAYMPQSDRDFHFSFRRRVRKLSGLTTYGSAE
jgi:hypothetical protein